MTEAGGVSQESTGIRPGVLLVPVAIREPYAQNLSEAEKESNPSHEAENISCMLLNLICTGFTGVVGETGSITGGIAVHLLEATAVETLLHVPLGTLRVIPTDLQQLILLLPVDGQTGAGNRELHNKHHEQDDHVEEQQDLVVLHGPDESGKSHEEEEDPHADDAPDHLETGDQTEPLPPRRDADHQQTHHNIEDVERTQGVFGAGESSAAHFYAQ